MKIEYKIMGVPSRGENIDILKSVLGLSDSDIFLDVEYRKNPMWTWKQTVGLISPDSSHVVIIQDDAILCNEFKFFCEYLVNRFPDDIISLSNSSRVHMPEGVIVQPGYCPGGVCMIIPCSYISDIIEEQESKFPDHIDDDNMICYWAYHHGVRVLAPHPSVVQTIPNGSLLGHHGRAGFSFEMNPCKRKWADGTYKKLINRRSWEIPNM